MIDLQHGCCLELMKNIPDKSVDMVLTDPPYGTTACKWDTVVDFDLMWKELKRITKDNGAICLFGQNPFSASLIMSNPEMYRYEWIWEKDQAKNFLFMKKQAGKIHENITVFYKKQPTYIPQMREVKSKLCSGGNKRIDTMGINVKSDKSRSGSKLRYPISILRYSSMKKSVHPTQKPVALLEYLIKTYTLENETVLDFTMGSGSTGVACKNLNRNFIGIEKEEKYFNIAKERMQWQQS